MNIIAQNALYIFLFVMVAVMLFDLFTIAYRYYYAKRIKKLENRFQTDLSNMNLSKMDEEYKQFLKRKLKNIDYLLSLFSVIENMSSNNKKKIIDILSEMMPSVYMHYEKTDTQKLIYLVYNFTIYPALCKDSTFLKKKLVTNCVSPIIYLRENSLKVLYLLGEVDLILEALYEMNLMNIHHNDKLITDGLLTFNGDDNLFIKSLLNNMHNYNEHYKVAIINYLTYKEYHCEEEIYKILSSKHEDKEVLLACIRYFRKIKYDKALPLLIGFVQADTKVWELSVVSANALVTYKGNKDVVNCLTKAVTSHVWYLRNNAAKSLVELVGKDRALSIINRTDDKYAKDALKYYLEIGKEGDK